MAVFREAEWAARGGGCAADAIHQRGHYRQVAEELGLQGDDDLLDVGCGAAVLLADHAAKVRYVAGLEASGIQLGKARSRLAERLAAGSAELVRGDMGSLPWEDGRFSAVAAVNVLKFAPDPPVALREMARVLRAGGRIVITIDDFPKQSWGGTERSGEADAFGQWQWTDTDIQRLLEGAGFVVDEMLEFDSPGQSFELSGDELGPG